MPSIRHTSRGRLAALDPRLKIMLAGCFGVATWQVDNTTLGIYAFVLWLICARAEFFTRDRWPMFRAYLLFVLLWVLLKFTLDTLPFITAPLMASPIGPLAVLAPGPLAVTPATGTGGATAMLPDFIPGLMPDLLFPPLGLLRQTAMDAALLGLRLCVLIGLGLLLALTTSPRQLGLALSWFLRPVLGKNAWKTALSLALMIHFLPLVQTTFAQVKQTIRLRQPKRSRWERVLLVTQATLRLLAQKTWSQTVAVAARGLDSPEAWVPHFPPQPLNWILGFLMAAAGLLPLAM